MKDRTVHRAAIVIGVTYVIGAGLLAGGCGGVTTASHPLSGAVYANRVPIYPSAIYKDSMGGTGYGDAGAVSESLSWFFEVPDSVEKMSAFYAGRLPGAERDQEGEEVTYTIAPEGAEPGENIVVTIRAGELQITESVKPGKRKG